MERRVGGNVTHGVDWGKSGDVFKGLLSVKYSSLKKENQGLENQNPGFSYINNIFLELPCRQRLCEQRIVGTRYTLLAGKLPLSPVS